MSFFKRKILESITPYYVVISGLSCIGKLLLIEKLSRYIISRGFNVKKANESILKGNENLLKIKNQDLEKFEYGLLNHYYNRRIELDKYIKLKYFVIIDREVFDGDIYKRFYRFDKEIVLKERMPRSQENSVYTLDETKRILSYYKNSFQNTYQDAIVINNNENIEITLVLMGKEISFFIKEKLDIYYKALRENPNDESIVFWFQGMIFQEYKKYLEGIRYEKYNMVILDRLYNDAEIFSRSMITSDFGKTNYLSYLSKKIDSIKFKPDCVIYISVNNFDILKERILKRGRDIEQDVDVEYFRLIFNMYEEFIGKIYPNYVEVNNSTYFSNNSVKKKVKDNWYKFLKNSVYNANFYKNVEEIQFSVFKKLDLSVRESLLECLKRWQDKIGLKVKDHIPLDESLEYMTVDINYSKAKKSHAEHLVEEKEAAITKVSDNGFDITVTFDRINVVMQLKYHYISSSKKVSIKVDDVRAFVGTFENDIGILNQAHSTVIFDNSLVSMEAMGIENVILEFNNIKVQYQNVGNHVINFNNRKDSRVVRNSS
ncbi:41843_t:CDS:2, partial [Gigaspora margarita]